MDTSLNSCILNDLSRLRESNFKSILISAAIIWLLYMVSGFRLPTQEITISDSNASATVRQLVFSLAGLSALALLFFNRAIGSALVSRLPIIFLTGFLFCSAIWSEQPSLTVKRGAIFGFGVLTLIALVHSTERPVASMARISTYFSASIAVLSLVFHVILPESHTVNPVRPGLAGLANHPNTLAPFVSIGLILSFAIDPISVKESRLKAFSQAVLALSLFLTLSITTLFTTVVCLGIYIFLASTTYRRGSLQIAALIGAISIATIGLDNIKSELFDLVGRDESLSGRDELWQIVWQQVKNEPLVGHGFGAFWTEGKGRELVQTWNPRQSHNTYLDVLLDLGTVGLLIVLAVFPVSLLCRWPLISGAANTPQRRATASMYAVAFGYLATYGFSQSYLLRFDIFPFFILVWITLLATNPDANRIGNEFDNSLEK